MSVKVSFEGSGTPAMSQCCLSCSPAAHGLSLPSAVSHTLPWLPLATCFLLSNSWGPLSFLLGDGNVLIS